MWNNRRVQYVEGVISRVALSFMIGDKDERIDALYTVEKDTGYDIDFIYDIFVEEFEDEMEDNNSIEAAVRNAADQTITVAYEYDY